MKILINFFAFIIHFVNSNAIDQNYYFNLILIKLNHKNITIITIATIITIKIMKLDWFNAFMYFYFEIIMKNSKGKNMEINQKSVKLGYLLKLGNLISCLEKALLEDHL